MKNEVLNMFEQMITNKVIRTVLDKFFDIRQNNSKSEQTMVLSNDLFLDLFIIIIAGKVGGNYLSKDIQYDFLLVLLVIQ